MKDWGSDVGGGGFATISGSWTDCRRCSVFDIWVGTTLKPFCEGMSTLRVACSSLSPAENSYEVPFRLSALSSARSLMEESETEAGAVMCHICFPSRVEKIVVAGEVLLKGVGIRVKSFGGT
jgi:hypothetical protein